MADRGFTISESVGLYQARLAIPPLQEGRTSSTQLMWKGHGGLPTYEYTSNALLDF